MTRTVGWGELRDLSLRAAGRPPRAAGLGPGERVVHDRPPELGVA